MPKAPNNLDEFDERIRENPELSKNYKGAVELNGEKIAAAFASDQLLPFFADSDMAFYDGTFFVVPKIFYQLFSISFKSDGHNFISLHFLMTGKSYEHYLAVFAFIKDLIPNWNPQVCHMNIRNYDIGTIVIKHSKLLSYLKKS